MTMSMSVKKIFRYPLKGFSGQELDEIAVETGETIPWDRAFAIENGNSGFDENHPAFKPKQNFLMLMKNEGLAKVQTTFYEDTLTLAVHENSKLLVQDSLAAKAGRQNIESAINSRFNHEIRGPVKILHSKGHSFSDISAKAIHLINLNTIQEIETALGKQINPMRFRANIYVDGLPAWQEFDLIDKSVTNGSITLKGFHATQRCAATNVNPESGERDLAIPSSLMKIYGHSNCGIYIQVVRAGKISVGSQFRFSSE